MTSYRSSPEITALFARLLPPDEQMRISSVQPAGAPAAIEEHLDDASYFEALRRAIEAARGNTGLTAVIVPWKHEARRLQTLLGESCPPFLDRTGRLPERGCVLITLPLAKGLEFDHVIVPDASARLFGGDDLSRRRLYTTISRATRTVTVLSHGALSPLLVQNG